MSALSIAYVAGDMHAAWLNAAVHTARMAGEINVSGIVATIAEGAMRVQFRGNIFAGPPGAVVIHNFGSQDDQLRLRGLMLAALDQGLTQALDAFVRRQIALLPATLALACECPDRELMAEAVGHCFFSATIEAACGLTAKTN